MSTTPTAGRLADDYTVAFAIDTSPLQSFFQLWVNLQPHHPSQTENVIIARFLTYEDPKPDRNPYPFTGKDGDRTIPPGPFDFSRQLFDLQHSKHSNSVLKNVAQVEQSNTDMLDVFSWKSRAYVKLAFGIPTQHLGPSVSVAVQKFAAHIDHALASGEPIHALVCKKSLSVQSRFRWLVSMPIPTPVSCWPWMRPFVHVREAQDREGLMEFTRNGFVLEKEYVRVALGVREKDWFKGPGPLRNLTNSKISPLPQIVRFRDYRQYLAHMLGGYAYEHQAGLSQTAGFYNGTHTCKVLPELSGISKLSPKPIWESILSFMSKPQKAHMWLFNTILAQDNFSNDKNKTAITLQELLIINENCAGQGLNGAQKEGVMSYFRNKLSIVVGPPGTGKSALVNTIEDIEASLSPACDVPTAKSFQPQGVIIFEASQLNETLALGAVLRALNGGKLKRMLLIGDRQQLPPTAKSPQNTFAANSELSLLERLILAGTP
ncbi:hypothetical protein IWX90DRAFT_490668 [Phyllosticta citrichinensis]|uniref:DNA2/NAM7 helicase helicase domain-containing protein n=1 Tax=Phyllosticta citrichinensis TaxID=1130410 RepID=A0ABR1XFT6_9PEZI